MRLNPTFLCLLVLPLLAGCGGGGGRRDDPPVTNAQVRVNWPARTREALQVPLTSAQSARIVFQQAGPSSTDVTLNINRDARTEAHTETYTIPQAISPDRLRNITATFFSEPNQGGVAVGTATTTATLVGTSVEFAPISLTGTITQVSGTGATLTVGDAPTQLQFSARDNQNAIVAVSPGSASWTVVDGSQFLTLTPDGVATPVVPGTSHVRVSVDGVTSELITVNVISETAPVFTWAGAKGGNPVTPTFNAVEGNKFRITGGKNVVVTHLGVEARSAQQPTSTTAIFDESGAVVASAAVAASDPQVGSYLYKEIAPVTLTAGSTYYIGTLQGSGPSWSYLHNTNVATVPAFIEDLGTHFKVSSTIEGGTWSSGGSIRHYVGNFQAYQAP